MNPLEKVIGFIGTGIMGRPMALNLLKKGFRLHVYNRTREKAREVVDAGGVLKASPREAAETSDIIITIVTDTPDVKAVLFGEKGVIHGARKGQTVIDMSTISPEATRDFAARLAEAGVDMLDAPVSGGELGAIQGTLTIMAGGDAEVFGRCRPVLEAMGTRITHVGRTGSGQIVKACNQIMCAVNQIAVSEALSLCYRAGIDLNEMHQVVTGGAGNSWALDKLGRKVIDGDLQPAFMVRLIQKDLNIVSELARGLNLPLPGTSLAVQLFRSVETEEGGGDLGTQAMIRAYERLGNFQLPR
ncbi:MAG: NAD(P)-dependent oxidoreductase [Nitrospinota bacterium]